MTINAGTRAAQPVREAAGVGRPTVLGGGVSEYYQAA
jgi:hypothetical protein